MKWIARYNDGEILPQYNEDGSENKYADIDRGRLTEFALVDNSNEPVFALHLDPGQRLIYRRRVEMRTGVGEFTVYLVGWQMTVGGQNIQSIAYISEDKQIHMAGAWRDDHPWFYSIQTVPCEEQQCKKLN